MLSRLFIFTSIRRILVVSIIMALNAALASEVRAAEPEPVSSYLAAADLEAGKKAARKCKACHTLDRKATVRFGPPLWSIVNRPIASVNGFSYSQSLKKLDGVWDYEALNAFLADPNSVAPKNRMRFTGIKSVSERAALIRYLRSLSDAPAPLPKGVEQASAAPSEQDEPEFGKLPSGPGREEVFYLCNACHSLRLVYQQGLSRDSWDETIEWMVKEQGMPELDPDERAIVVDYLAKNFGIPKGRQPLTPMSAPPMAPPPPKI